MPSNDPRYSEAVQLSNALLPLKNELTDRHVTQRRHEIASRAAAKKEWVERTASEREQVARNLEKMHLEGGMDIYTRVEGRHNTTIRMHYALMSRPLAYKLLQRKEVLDQLHKSGFETLILTDGSREWACELQQKELCSVRIEINSPPKANVR
jgi:hypothetical protein